MKKIKGGKRVGSGRKKTGRTTKVISFSIPIELEEEIRVSVKDIIATKKKKETKISPELHKYLVDQNKRIIEKYSSPNYSPEFISKSLTINPDIQKQISDYEEELKHLGDSILAKKRKEFVNRKISELKKQIK